MGELFRYFAKEYCRKFEYLNLGTWKRGVVVVVIELFQA